MEVKSGYKQTELGIIPKDWNIIRLVEMVSFIGSGKSHVTSEFSDFPVYGSTGIIGRSTYGDYSGKAILIARVGANAGKINVVDGTYGVTDNTIIVKLNNSFNFVYITQQLKEKKLNSMVFGSGQPLITGTQIKKIFFPHPPLEEQTAIATALSDADALIESIEQLLTKKRDIKQAAMQQLLTGRQRLPGFRGKWEKKSFDEIVIIRNQKIDSRRATNQLFCIELEHIDQRTGRLIGFTDTNSSSSIKSVFQKGDVLFGKLRAYLRKFWLADRDGVCSTEIWPLISIPQIIIEKYLFQLVQTNGFIETACMAYGTHMPRTDWNVVKNYQFLLPDTTEQTAIAEVLSDMDAEITVLEEKLAKARQVKQGMMQELLTGRIRLI